MLILSSHLALVHPSGFFLSSFSMKLCMHFLSILCILHACILPLSLVWCSTLLMFGEECKLWSYLLCNFLSRKSFESQRHYVQRGKAGTYMGPSSAIRCYSRLCSRLVVLKRDLSDVRRGRLTLEALHNVRCCSCNGCVSLRSYSVLVFHLTL